MKVYLAGPMRDIPKLNFPAFRAAAARLRAQGFEVFDPSEQGADISLREAFANDTQYICLHAEAIALLPGWNESRGATIEYALAKMLGLMVIEL